MFYFAALVFVAGFGLPIAVLSAAISQAKVGTAAMDGIARQPEAAGKIQIAMMIALGFIESLIIYALVMFLMLSPRLPDTAKMLELLHK